MVSDDHEPITNLQKHIYGVQICLLKFVLFRFLQYASKFSQWYVAKFGLDENFIEKLKSLENSFSATRKGNAICHVHAKLCTPQVHAYWTLLTLCIVCFPVLRLGKSVDLLAGAYNSLTIKDVVVKLALVLAKINQAVYLIVDHKVWLIKLGVLKGDAKPYAKLAAKFWLVTIIFNLIRNLSDILTIISRHKSKTSKDYKDHKTKSALQEYLSNKPMVIDTVKNVSDLSLPLAGLNYINISVGLQGVLGMLSSVMAMLQSWDPAYKLLPA